MKKDSYFFPHDSNAHDDPKVMILLAEWGLEGYGIYWILIEHLRNQKDFKAPLTILKPLALRFGSTEEKFRTIVQRYSLFEVDKRENFFSLSLIRRMKPLQEKRHHMKQLALRRWHPEDYDSAHALPTQSEGNASKVKKRRVEHSKEKDNIYNAIIEFFNSTTGKNIKLTTSRKKEINGRVNDGYDLDDFKKVIETMNKKWKDDKKMKQFITPDTLFRASKFPKYREMADEKKNDIPESMRWYLG